MGSTARKRFRRHQQKTKIVPRRQAALRRREHGHLALALPAAKVSPPVGPAAPRTRDRLDLLLQVPDDKRASFLRLHDSYDDPRLLNARFAGYLDQVRAAALRGRAVSDPDYGRRAHLLRGAAPDPGALLAARRRLLLEENALGLAVEYCGFGGLSMAEAGVVLGCSKSTVSRRVRGALALLERWLREAEAESGVHCVQGESA